MKFNEVFGNAKWVTCEEGCISPYIRAEFEAPCRSAEITLCGFGYANLYINGRRVGDEFFLPLNSCYHYNPNLLCVKNDGEELGSRTYPVKYDISDYLKEGKNALCVHLGPGWYAHGDMQKQEDEWIKPYGVVKAAWRVPSRTTGCTFLHGFLRSWNALAAFQMVDRLPMYSLRLLSFSLHLRFR